MRLSEAILLGSVGTEQCFGDFFNDGITCALGAALFAIGEHKASDACDNSRYDLIWKHWAWTQNLVNNPSDCDKVQRGSVIKMIWQLNDLAEWTRPQIAAWVAEQEVRLGVVDTQVGAEVKDGEHATA